MDFPIIEIDGMKVVEVAQGSDEWHRARAGHVTASRVADIVRRTKSGISASRATYLGELVAERLSGQPTPGFTTKAMEFGKETEAAARENYAFTRDVVPKQVGLVLHPRIAKAAASPDSLVGSEGLLEIKCPNTKTHIDTLLGEPIEPDYMKQMQWQMACTGRIWTDFVSFDPRLPSRMAMKVIRVHRDAGMIMELETAVRAFISELDEMVATLNAKFPEAA